MEQLLLAETPLAIPLRLMQDAVQDSSPENYDYLLRVFEMFAAHRRATGATRELLPWGAVMGNPHEVLAEFLGIPRLFSRRREQMPPFQRRRLTALVCALYDALAPTQRALYYRHCTDPPTGHSWLYCITKSGNCPELAEALITHCNCQFNAHDAIKTPFIIFALVSSNMHRELRIVAPTINKQQIFAAVDDQTPWGCTPLFRAVRMLDVECTRALLHEYDADPAALPLDDACRWLLKYSNRPESPAILELLTRRERLLAVIMGIMEPAILAARGEAAIAPKSHLHHLPLDTLQTLIAPRVLRAE